MQAFHELLTWYGLIDEGVVLCKDGAYLAGWTLEGIDTEPMDAAQVAARTLGLGRAVQTFGDQDGFWVDFARRPMQAYRTSQTDFGPRALQIIEAERAAFFAARGSSYTNRLTLCYHWKPPARTGDTRAAFAERCALVESRFGVLYSLTRMGRARQSDPLHAIPRARDALLGRLASGLSGQFTRVNVPRIPVYLDRILAPEWVHGWPFSLPRISGRPAAIISIDGYPATSAPEMLAALEELTDIDYHWSTRFLPLTPGSARRRIDAARRAWSFSRSSLRQQMSAEDAAPASGFSDTMAMETRIAEEALEAGEMSFGEFTSVITLFASPRLAEADLRAMAGEVVTALVDAGFTARIETLGALEAFLSTLPGHRRENIRGGMLSTQSFADLIPISTIWSGQPTNPSDKFAGDAPALLRAQSASGEPYFFNLHSRDVGHTLVFGPTGSGKSVLLGLIASNFLKYARAQVFVFDRMRSMYTLTRAIGGTHVDLSKAALSPLKAGLGHRWALDWLEKLCALGACEMTPQRRRSLNTALRTLDPASDAPLEELVAGVQDADIRAALEAYLADGAYAGVVDAATDDLALSEFTVFEAADLLEQGPRVAVPVLDYIFERIEARLTGAPSVILLDEAWSFLGHDLFEARINAWIRELRKANCALVLATQFIGDALSTGLSGALIQSCQTRIFLADPDARGTRISAAYRQLDLTEAQIDLVAGLRRAQDYYVVKPEGRRIVDFCLGPKALRILGATDLEDSARTEALWRKHPDTWWQDILEETS